MYVSFYGVNTPAIADFKLPTYHRMQSWKEDMWTIVNTNQY